MCKMRGSWVWNFIKIMKSSASADLKRLYLHVKICIKKWSWHSL